MRITHEPDRQRFVARIGPDEVGYLTYRETGRVMDLRHTLVQPAFEGRGIGSGLVLAALEAARASGSTVIPTCPFIPPVIARHPEYRDLVDPGSTTTTAGVPPLPD